MSDEQNLLIPSTKILLSEVIKAINVRGGQANARDIDSCVIASLALSNETVNIPHGNDGSRTELKYRLAWARTNAKKQGLIERVGKGIWSVR